MSLLPDRDALTIVFGHRAYRLADAFARLGTGIRHVQCFSPEELEDKVAEADVLVASFLWRDSMLDKAGRLRFIQSVSAGTDHFPKERLRARGVRLASAQGSNERAVAEHAMALILSFSRHLHTGRDHQTARVWRGMIGDPAAREFELGGRTLAIVGMGRIGSRLAHLARAFGMRVIGVRREGRPQPDVADLVLPTRELKTAVAQADVVALTCPLTPETENLIDAGVLAAMKPSALLINVARGRVVDEDALVAALREGRIAGAGLDCTREEPLPEASPLWGMGNVVITPHTAGETDLYESNLMALLTENLDRLWRGEADLRNQVV